MLNRLSVDQPGSGPPFPSQGAGESMRTPRSRLSGAGRLAAVTTVAVLGLVACGGGSGGGDDAASTGSESAAAPADAPEGAIKIGVLTTCGGPFASFEAEPLSGAKYALIKDAGGKAGGTGRQAGAPGAPAGGKPVAISYGCSDATPDKAV